MYLNFVTCKARTLYMCLDILVTLTVHISHFWQSAAAVLVHKFFSCKRLIVILKVPVLGSKLFSYGIYRDQAKVLIQ